MRLQRLPGNGGNVLHVATASEDVSNLIRWSESLAGTARTGLAFTSSIFEKERFHEILDIAADIAVSADEQLDGKTDSVQGAESHVHDWLDQVAPGIAGYVTPRVAIGALVGNDAGELLLVQRGDSGVWLYPTGWADIGYSATEVAVKEVAEETGLHIAPVRLAMVIDGVRAGISRIPLYSLVFHCKIIGGELKAHPLECRDVGFFAKDNLPEPLANFGGWIDRAFHVLSGEEMDVFVDAPRDPVWRSAGTATS